MGQPWDVARHEAHDRARVAFPFPHRVRFVGLRTEAWARAKHPRCFRRERTMRLPTGKPYAGPTGALVARVALFVVEPTDPT